MAVNRYGLFIKLNEGVPTLTGFYDMVSAAARTFVADGSVTLRINPVSFGKGTRCRRSPILFQATDRTWPECRIAQMPLSFEDEL